MKDIPIEVFDSIFQNVPKSDYPICSMVCSQWNYLINRYLYSTIRISSEECMHSFLEGLTLYPRCMEAGKHIKKIDMSSLSTATPFKIHSSVNIDHIDALIHCPNIEQLEVEGFPDMILSFMDPRMPTLNKLKFLCFMHVDSKAPAEIIDCFYKFRSSLTYLDLTGLTHILDNFSPEDIISYIGAFSHVNNLKIELPFSTELKTLPTFDSILDKCPQLSHMLYKSSSLNVPDYNSQSPLKQSSVSNAELDLAYVSMNDIYYIKDKFKCLTHLSLSIINKLTNEPEVIDALMDISTLTDLSIELRNSYRKDTLNAFWKHVTPSSHSRTNSSKISFWSYFNDTLKLKYTFCSGVKSMSSEISITSETVEEFDLGFVDYLDAHGSHIHNLDLSFHGHQLTELQTLNRLFPELTNLTIDYATMPTSSDLITPSYNLISLMLDSCLFSVDRTSTVQTFFSDIDAAFPMLKRLDLVYPDFDDEYNENMVYEIQLPEQLKVFTLSKSFILISPWHAVVVKEVNGIHEVSWYCDEDTLNLYTKNEDVVQEYAQSICLPVFVFRSKTLEYVDLSVGDLFNPY
ncbi:hypothetical protein BDB01DRAFT_786118 [Pilobolus umbonatus]|nr:hypothetical protein BDB01DRAFT_786118 [Pilobolus umbonatus]